VTIILKKGELWTKISKDDFKDENSRFIIKSARANIASRGGIINISSDKNQDVFYLIEGDQGEISQENFPSFKLGVGQKVIISPSSLKELKNDKSIIEEIDNIFRESFWNLKNLKKFYPEKVSTIEREIGFRKQKEQNFKITEQQKKENPNEIKKEETDKQVDKNLASPTFIKPVNLQKISALRDSVSIQGTVPVSTYQVVINNYTLTRYTPGDKKWTYVASKKFGTLLPGKNVYKVYALMRDGRKTPTAELEIFYEGVAPVSPVIETGKVVKKVVNNEEGFKAPVIISPAIFSKGGDVYQTSSPTLVIKGSVDPATTKVLVNGFLLQKFKTGDKEFNYIANANYGNMKAGENTYTIVAVDKNGRQARTVINIVYEPTLK